MTFPKIRLSLLVSVFLVSSVAACGPSTPQVTPQLLNLYVTSAAYPWLSEVYTCASSSIAVNLSDPTSAEISLRLGQPESLTGSAYQIASENILVVVHPGTGVGSLTLEQVRRLFLGQVTNWKDLGGNDLPVQVWTFALDEDVQQVFDREVMRGQPVTSLARLAVSAQTMSNSVGTETGSVGILPGHWKAGNVETVYTVASVPVLAITGSEPRGNEQALLGCLQAGN